MILLCSNDGLPPPAGTITCLGICSRVELQHQTQTVPIFTSAHLENIKTLQYLITVSQTSPGYTTQRYQQTLSL